MWSASRRSQEMHYLLKPIYPGSARRAPDRPLASEHQRGAKPQILKNSKIPS
jgi:hypothetical protein